MSFTIIYDRNRFPIQQKRPDGLLGCRGCGGVIPPKRQTWCSNACYLKFHPRFVLNAVRRRDKGICHFCGFNCDKDRMDWIRSKRTFGTQANLPRPPKIEIDHIIPFCEGGLTVIENLRSYCKPCHDARTAQWRKDRKKSIA